MHVVKNPQDKNAIATLDRAIQAIKPLLNDGAWAKTLQKVVSGHNAAPSSHLMDSAPDDVPDSKKLQFAMKWQGIEDREHNESNIAKRGQRLEREGTFRVEERVDKMTRGFKPRFGDKVHTVGRVEGPTVVDGEGARFSTKFVQPVPPGSRSTGAGSVTRASAAPPWTRGGGAPCSPSSTPPRPSSAPRGATRPSPIWART